MNPIETLWQDLETAIHEEIPANLKELTQHCKGDWARTLSQQHERLKNSHRKPKLQQCC